MAATKRTGEVVAEWRRLWDEIHEKTGGDWRETALDLICDLAMVLKAMYTQRDGESAAGFVMRSGGVAYEVMVRIGYLRSIAGDDAMIDRMSDYLRGRNSPLHLPKKCAEIADDAKMRHAAMWQLIHKKEEEERAKRSKLRKSEEQREVA